jgi:hypothetical protein
MTGSDLALKDTLPRTNACGDETNRWFWLALKDYFACARQVRDRVRPVWAVFL